MYLARLALALFALGAEAGATLHYKYDRTGSAAPSVSRTEGPCAASRGEFTTYAGVPEPAIVRATALDASGGTVVVGGSDELFAAKADPAGCLVFTIRMPGAAGSAVALDGAGVLHIAAGGRVLRFAADGSRLLASAVVDGTLSDIALDSAGDLYLTGTTYASGFPDDLRVSAVQPRFGVAGVGAAFFLKLEGKALTRVTSGYLAGQQYDCGGGSSCFTRIHTSSGLRIAVDRDRNIVFAGNSEVRDLPTTPGALRPAGIGAFVAKVSADGRRLLYSTWLGERSDPLVPLTFPATEVLDMIANNDGSVTLCGRTRDENFPATAGSAQPAYSGPVVPRPSQSQFDGFVARLNASGSAMVWATFLGSADRSELFDSVSVDPAGTVWVSGRNDASSMLMALDAAGSRIAWAGSFAPGWLAVSESDRSGLMHTSSSSGLLSVFRPPQLKERARILALTSGAGEVTGEIAPGQIVSIFGVNIGPEKPAAFTLDSNGRVPDTLGGTRVFFDELPGPVLYASRHQVNAIVPNLLRPRKTLRVRVADETAPFTAYAAPSSPSLFAVTNLDGSPNAETPAAPGAPVTLWLTGTGADSRPDGSVADGAMETGCCSVRGGDLLYAGDAPGFVTALTQMNVRVAENPAQLVTVTTGDGRTLPVTVYVGP